MEAFFLKNDNVIEYYVNLISGNHEVCSWYLPMNLDYLNNGLDGDLKTLCIAYPKGKRPKLPYPQNPSKNG